MNFMELDPASPVTRFNQRGFQAGLKMIGDLTTGNFGGFLNDTFGAGDDIIDYYNDYPTIEDEQYQQLKLENQRMRLELENERLKQQYKETFNIDFF